LGLQDSGFSVLLGVDNDADAVRTHTANLRGLGYVGELSDASDLLAHLDAWGIESVDLLSAGIPCQPFSRAGSSKLRSLVSQGSRSGDDARAHLWDSFLEVVRALRPRAVLLENVPDLVSWNDGAVLVGFREGLKELGYWNDARVLEGPRFGVPQYRQRLFIIGLRDVDRFDWPPEAEPTTLRDAIGDLPPVGGGQRLETLPYGTPRQSALAARLRKGVATDERGLVHDHITRSVRPDDAEAFAIMQPGGTYDDVPHHLRRYRSDIFTDKYKRLEWDLPSRTITAHLAKDGYWYIHPDQNRTLSVREAARIQTFPDWYRFSGHPTARYRHIGNAVPPMLAQAVGSALMATLSAPQSPRPHRTSIPNPMRSKLISWHHMNSRRFPWREGATAWHVLMAEMCLHRTRASQVVPVFEQLVRIAPTPTQMVGQRDVVLTTMASLGLKWRAENLVAVAEQLVTRFGGEVPGNEADLLTLPGVGDYVANAVLCFAFGRRAVLLDTNTERIMSRVSTRRHARRWQTRLDLYELAGKVGPDAEFNYALLDLGALVCKANKPDCISCPLRTMCVTSLANTSDVPLKLTSNVLVST